MIRNPSSRMSKSDRGRFSLLMLLINHFPVSIDVATWLAASDIMNPNRKCSNMSSSEKIGRRKKWSMNTVIRSSKKGKITRPLNEALSMLFR
jgi:hypothetical protein